MLTNLACLKQVKDFRLEKLSHATKGRKTKARKITHLFNAHSA